MAPQELTCPNCETVMDLRYFLHMPEHIWYECAICGHRAVPRDGRFETPEDELQPPDLPIAAHTARRSSVRR